MAQARVGTARLVSMTTTERRKPPARLAPKMMPIWGIGDADVGEVDDGKDGHHPSGGVAGEASGVEEVGVEGGPAGGGGH